MQYCREEFSNWLGISESPVSDRQLSAIALFLAPPLGKAFSQYRKLIVHGSVSMRFI